MKDIYQGFHPAIAAAYVEGKRIQFKLPNANDKEWLDVLAYHKPLDLYRVSSKSYEFRVKPVTTTANIHVHVCPRKNTVWATADQQPCADNIKVTFDENGTPIAVELL
jgi:hypothetical protein